MFKQILVTGGAGFIGSNFIHYALHCEPDIQIINLDALTYAGSLQNLQSVKDHERLEFIYGDICNQELVEKLLLKYDIDSLVHFAAESHVDRSIHGPGAFIQTNIQGTFSLLEAVRKVWLSGSAKKTEEFRFHHISTDEVYGSLSPTDPPFEETTSYAPNSPYSASKASSDFLVRSYHHTYGLPISITNCSNNYGPYQFPEKLIPLIIINAVTGKQLPIYGDGKQIRDWLYVEDHCEAIWKVLQNGENGCSYNIGGNNQPTNLEIVNTICVLLDEYLPVSPFRPHQQLISFVKDRPGHDRRYAMNINKITHDLGWTPNYNLQDGLRSTVKWYLDNNDWVQAISENKDYDLWIGENYQNREGVN
jgi:dTDP-glucose 4,6-dehydratase